MLELEVKELIARHKTDLQEKTSKVTQVSALHIAGLMLPPFWLTTTCLCWAKLRTRIAAERPGKTFIILPLFDQLFDQLGIQLVTFILISA